MPRLENETKEVSPLCVQKKHNTTMIIVFWDVTPRSLVHGCQCSLFTLKIGIAGVSGKHTPIYQTVWHHIPDGCDVTMRS